MTNLVFKEITNNDINFTKPIRGQVLYCVDTGKTYYDNANLYRINITLNTFIVDTESDRESLLNPLINKVYIVLGSKKLYQFDGSIWCEINYEPQLYQVVSTLSEFVSGVLTKDGKLYAPASLASQVYMNDGTRLESNLSKSRILSVTRTKPVYVEATKNNQRVFTIPFPIVDYDFKENHMSIILRNEILEPTHYVVNNDKLILNKEIHGLLANEQILFIFYYTEHIDLNDNVVLHTKNYADKSITTEKLSDSIRIDSYNIIENPDRIFLTVEEKNKLKGIEENATCYHHPATHPASMIVPDALHEFVSEIEKNKWNAKADADSVYTKQQTDERIKKVVGAAPEALDTLNELAEALGNDENFSATISNELGKKVNTTDFEKLQNDVKTKVNLDDYVRSPMYGTPSRTNKKHASYYNLAVADPNFKEYIDGMQVILKIDQPNIGDSFLSINNMEAKHIITVEGYPLIESELNRDSIYTLRFNGTTGNFILQGKGGVKLRDTSSETYFVEKGQSITRGDVVDIQDHKVIHSVPRARVLSNYETYEDKYKSEGNIELYKIDDDRFIIFWKFKKKFQVEVISINNGFIEVSPLVAKKPVVISEDCINFKVDTMENKQYILSFSDSKNIVKTQIVTVNTDSTIILGDSYSQDEDQLITNINIIYTKNNRAIIGWNYGNKTRCLLISTLNSKISVISGRDNVQYPLDNYCLIDSNNILFVAFKDHNIEGWVMSISDNDFANTNISSLVSSKDNDYNTPVLTLIGERKVLSEWTDKVQNNLYRQFIEIDYKGKITFSEPKTIDTENYRIQSKILPSQKLISEDFFVAPSNMNYKMPSVSGGKGDKCIKITVTEMNFSENKCTIVDTHSSITKVTADNLAYDMIGNHMILAYNTKTIKTDDTHLYFAVADVRKIPYGVAMSNAIENELVTISKW